MSFLVSRCALGVAVLWGSLAAGCTRHPIVDFAMSSAFRPPRVPISVRPPYRLLAGDLHCHVTPPDLPGEASRGLRETLDLARRERLDFVVFTPHVGPRFYEDSGAHARVRARFGAFQRAVERVSNGRTLFFLGFEYTDGRYGHVGGAFGDLARTLAEVTPAAARRAPERFFERWVDTGGLLVLNHPLVTPLDSIFTLARRNLSWRLWTASPSPLPPEIRAIDRLASAVEAYNLTVSHLRDRLLIGDALGSLRATLARIDREIVARGQRLIPVAGSDSHSHFLRPTMFLLARDRTARAIREAVLAGRVCLRGPRACTFEARAPGGRWVGVGGEIAEAGEVEVRARGASIRLRRDGAPMLAGRPGHVRSIPVARGRCSVLRAEVDDGFSGPIYVNCPFARGGAAARDASSSCGASCRR